MKKQVAITATALIVISLFTSPAFASERKPTASPTATTSSDKKPMMSSTSKMRAMKAMCSPSTAVGHTPLQTGLPKVKKPVRVRTITLNTNCGEISFTADGTKAPLTVTAMTFLATSGYFDQSICHRLTTSGIFVLQCGDPKGTGQGGPAFMYPDENLPTATQNNYPAGTIAMANSGPNTNGSQFFIVYADTTLSPNYTIWGKVTKGLDIVKAIAAVGVADRSTDGAPKQAISIESVSVK